jgi:8-oxo-dGTP diphosphatase
MDEVKKYPRVGVGVMMMRDGKVLLGQRHPDPRKAGSELHGEGQWTMPGGKLEFGKKLVEAAQRELLEETGIKLGPEKFKVISMADDIGTEAHFVTIGFLVAEFEGEPRVMEPETITCWKWFEINDLPKPMYGPSREVVENFKKKTMLN